MERMSNPEDAAVAFIAQRANLLLARPQILCTRLRYCTDLCETVRLELRATVETAKELAYEQSSRYIYVYNLDYENEQLCLSVNLDSPDDSEDSMQSAYALSHALAEANNADPQLVSFVRDAAGVQAGALPAGTIEAMYIKLLEQATLLTSKIAWRELSDQQRLIVFQSNFEGPDAAEWHKEYGDPTLRVELEEGDFSTVLDIMFDGSRETYKARSNLLDELASIVPEENITRGDDGQVKGVVVAQGMAEAARAAERAAFGLPQVQYKHLKVIAAALRRI